MGDNTAWSAPEELAGENKGARERKREGGWVGIQGMNMCKMGEWQEG